MSSKNKLQSERELIYLLLHNKDAIARFYDYGVSVNSFSEDHRSIILLILEAYDRDDVLLTRKSFKEKLKKYKIPKERISLELAFNFCYSSKVSMDDFPMLAKKIIDQNIKESLNKALDELRKKTSEDGEISAIKDLINDCEDILEGSKKEQGKIYYDDIRSLSKDEIQYIEDVRSGKIEREPIILSGFREIDYTMVTGFEKGTLTLICADVGGFKSSMMLNIGLNVWINGFNVLFVPLEMHRRQMWRRACAREARIDTRLITRYMDKLTDEQMETMKEMNDRWDTYPSKFFMMEEPGNTTVSKIQRQIEKHIDIIKPKLVVIDYIANLEAEKNRYGRNDLEIGDMLKSLRQMGKDIDFAVLSAAQLGRKALERIRKAGANRDKASIHSEDIRGSHEYSADADNIYAQLPNPHQPNELLDIYCVKSRNGPTIFEGGSMRATLDIHPEIGLIASPMQYHGPSDGEGEDDTKSYNEDVNNLMDKTEKDDVISDNDIFEEDDDMYEYDKNKDDNKDIENAIEDEEWNEDW